MFLGVCWTPEATKLEDAISSLPVPVRAGDRTDMLLPAGQVSALLVPLRLDRRRRSAHYEMRVVNETPQALSSRAYVVGGRRGREPVEWVELGVPAFSSVAMELELPTPQSGRFERALVELDAPRTHLRLSAPPPPPPFSAPWRAMTMLTMGAVLLMLFAVLGAAGAWWLWERPRLTALSTNVDALRAQMTAIAALARRLPAQATRAPATAQILAFSARRVQKADGQWLVTDYRVVGRDGTVRLSDSAGHLLSEVPFSITGHTALLVPSSAQGEEVEASLVVQRGASQARTLVALAAPAPAASDAARGSEGAAAGGDDSQRIFAVARRVVHAGDTIRVTILQPEPQLHVALTGDDGSELDGVDVDPSQRRVTLHAPAVSVPTRLTVVATYTRGDGQDTVVAPLDVLP